MPFRYLVFFRLSACGYGTVERQNRGEKKKKKMHREKTKRRNNAWQKDEIVNYATRTDVNHENKREKTKKTPCK